MYIYVYIYMYIYVHIYIKERVREDSMEAGQRRGTPCWRRRPWHRALRQGTPSDSWPLPDIRSLQRFLALVNSPFIAPSICIAHTTATLLHD